MSETQMDFFVVSSRPLICELVSAYCEDQGFGVRGSGNSLLDIPDGPDAFTVILHISVGDPLHEADVDLFQQTHPGARIIVLCSKPMHDQVLDLFSSKVEAIIVDDSSLRALTSVLTIVQEGFRITLPLGQVPAHELGEAAPHQPAQALSFAGRPPAHSASYPSTPQPRPEPEDGPYTPDAQKLSLRERAVISKLSEGASNKDIAKELRIGESTVKVHLRSCYRKIGVRNRTQAAIWAAKHIPL